MNYTKLSISSCYDCPYVDQGIYNNYCRYPTNNFIISNIDVIPEECPLRIEDIRTLEFDDYDITYELNNDLKVAIYQAVLGYFIRHKAFSGEHIMQDDSCIIDAPELLSYIADEIFEFKLIGK